MNACCVLRPIKSFERLEIIIDLPIGFPINNIISQVLRGHRRTFAGIHPYPSGCCCVPLISVENAKRSRTFPSPRPRAATYKHNVRHPYPLGRDFVKSSTRQRVIDVYCV